MTHRFRKKPIEIEAVQMPTKDGDLHASPLWLREAMERQDVFYMSSGDFSVRTLEGVMTGRAGDWIIKGVEGEIYPCKRTIFEATYELAP